MTDRRHTRPSAEDVKVGTAGEAVATDWLVGAIQAAGTGTSRNLAWLTDLKLTSVIEAVKVLTSSASPADTLDRLARTAVPAFGDFCVVVVPNDHELHVVASAHADPAKDVYARLLRGPVPLAPAGGSPAYKAFQKRESVTVGGLDGSAILGWFGDQRYAQIAEGLGIRTVVAMPLESRRTIVGVMSLGYCEDIPLQISADLEGTRLLSDLAAVAVQQFIDFNRRSDFIAAFRPRWRDRRAADERLQACGVIQVMLIDSLCVVREGIRLLVEQQTDMVICAEASSLADALQQEAEPDVIVTELILGTDGRHTELVSSLVERFPKAKVLVLSRMAEPLYVHLALQHGAKGYLTKEASPTEVTDAIAALARDEEYVQPTLGSALARWQHRPGNRKLVGMELTRREHEVLELVARGHTNSKIAAILGLSLRTVETHRSHLARKLGVRSRAELVEAARDLDTHISY